MGTRFDLVSVLIMLGMIAILVVHSWLIRRRTVWLGGIIPLAFVGFLVVLAVRGQLREVRDFGFAALGLFGLLSWWARARQRRNDKASHGDQ